ncbi:MAG: hypothetical protein ACLR78_00395 [Roseburia sp.]
MGIGVGAACPVLLSSGSETNKNGKRISPDLSVFNDLFGMLFWSIVFLFCQCRGALPVYECHHEPGTDRTVKHGFRAATILVLLPFIKWIEKNCLSCCKRFAGG